MKKKGFTLIELLAVIVVLAIIALIATPIVMNLIKNAGKGAAERSGERYLKAVETMIATERAKDGTIVEDGTYTIGDGKISKDGKEYTIEVTGDYPKEGSIVIANGQVVSSGTSMKIGDYTVTVDNKGKATASEASGSTPAVSKLCTAEEGTALAVGSEYTCNLGDGERTFYVLKIDGDNIKLIMDANINDGSSWTDASAALSTATTGWQTLKQANGTVELPDAEDIGSIIPVDERGDVMSFLTPDWARINPGTNGGYWTSTEGLSGFAVMFDAINGNLSGMEVERSYGIRPVIVISESNI